MALNVPDCDDLDWLSDMKKAVSRATRKSNAEFRRLRASDDFVQSLMDGSLDLAFKREQLEEMGTYVRFLREIFSGYIIRRTIDSIDYRGDPISGLRKYFEKRLLLAVREEEKTALENTASDIMKEHETSRAAAMVAQAEGHVSTLSFIVNHGPPGRPPVGWSGASLLAHVQLALSYCTFKVVLVEDHRRRGDDPTMAGRVTATTARMVFLEDRAPGGAWSRVALPPLSSLTALRGWSPWRTIRAHPSSEACLTGRLIALGSCAVLPSPLRQWTPWMPSFGYGVPLNGASSSQISAVVCSSGPPRSSRSICAWRHCCSTHPRRHPRMMPGSDQRGCSRIPW